MIAAAATPRSVPALVATLAAVIVGAALAAVALANWPAADDFCNRVIVAESGIGGAMRWLFFEWSGRLLTGAALYSTFALVDLPSLHFVSLALAGVLAFAAWQVASLAATDDRSLGAALFAFAFAAFAVGLRELLGQTVFWPTGGIVYMLPLVLALAWLSSVRRLLRALAPAPVRAGYGFLLGLAVGNAIELAWPIVASYVAIAVAPRWRALAVDARRAIAWRVAGVAAGAMLLVVAPGNYARAKATPDSFRLDPGYLGGEYLRMLREVVDSAWPMIAIVIALCVASIVAWRHSPRPMREPAGVVVEAGAIAVGALGSLVPVLAVPVQFAPRNGLYLLVFIFAAALLAFADVVQRSSWRRYAAPALAWIAVVLALTAGAQLAADARMAGAIRERELVRDRSLREAVRGGREDAVVAPIGLPVPRTLHYVDVGADRTQWNNRCTAKYYGLRTIALDPHAR